MPRKIVVLELEDGTVFRGISFGADTEAEGEVVFNTGMVGYPESFTDPSYRGQILSLTYPLIGNYGVPAIDDNDLSRWFESGKVQISGLVVSELSQTHHHWSASKGLADWLSEEGIPGIAGVDTRALTKRLRSSGTMYGRIVVDNTKALSPINISSFTGRNLVAEVSIKAPQIYNAPSGKKRVVLVDCGCKNTIIASMLKRGVSVVRVPWDADISKIDCSGVLFSNGPGDPCDCDPTIKAAAWAFEQGLPVFGICLGNQIMGLAVGAKTFKLKFGHRSQNQPCLESGSKRCFITSQNHGYAVDTNTLPPDWEIWFTNANDGTNEGIRHKTKPFMSVQFHPEAMPGPVDTGFLFDEFISMLK